MQIHKITGGAGLQLAVHEYGEPHGKSIMLIHGFSQSHLTSKNPSALIVSWPGFPSSMRVEVL